jgi:amino acid transporter
VIQAPRKLPRVLRLFDITVLAAASMGPAYSLASTMGLMVVAAGTAAPLALLALTGIMLCVAAAYSALSRKFPDAGSSYAWVKKAFGTTAGIYTAWILLISNVFATAATAMPAGVYTLDLLAPGTAGSSAWDAAVGVVWIVCGALLLHLGLRPTALTTAIFVLAEFVVLGASAIAAFFVHPIASPAPVGQIAPGIGGIVSAMVLAVWMVDGWEVSASASEETRNRDATAGRGGFIGLLVTCAVLAFAMIAYMRVGTIAGFSAHQADAMTYVAQCLGGGYWRWSIVVTVLLSTSSALWTTLLYLTRSVYAMGRDGVLPRSLGVLDAKGGATRALVAVTALVCVITLLNGFWSTAGSAMQFVVNGSSVFLGLLFVGSCAAAVRLASLLASGITGRIVAFSGGAALLAVLVIALLQADETVRLVDLGLLAAGLVFTAVQVRRGTPQVKGIFEGGKTTGTPQK